MKSGRIGVGISVKILIASLLLWTGAATANAIQVERIDVAKMSPGLAKVVEMIDSGVNEDVVLAYVQSAAVPKPNADEVIQLHDAGVPDRITLALLSRKQVLSTPQNNASEAPATPAYVQPPATPPQAPMYVQRSPVYMQPDPVVIYDSPSYFYDYPYYRYGYSYWPSVSLGFGFGFGHPFFGHHGFVHGGHFGGHFGGGFGGHTGFVGGHHGGHWGHR